MSLARIRPSRTGLLSWSILAHCAFLTTAPTFAGDWFVDASANCAVGDGSAAAPFCTISEAIAAASLGDTIHVTPGSYVEALRVDKDVSIQSTDPNVPIQLDGATAGTALFVDSGIDATVDGFSITGGSTSPYASTHGVDVRGGLTLKNSTISGIGGGSEAAVRVFGSLRMTQSSIESTFSSGVGGLELIDSNPADFSTPYARVTGSTIASNNGSDSTGITSSFPMGATRARLVLRNSTVRDGFVGAGGFTGISGRFRELDIAYSLIADNFGYVGAGIRATVSDACSIQNSTLTGNRGTYSSSGIRFLSSAAGCTIRNVTVARNRAFTTQRGISSSGGTPPSIANSIFANNTSTSGPSYAQDVGSGVTSAGYNLIGSANMLFSPEPTDLIGATAALGTLANNGGPTMTLALLPTSDAIDAGPLAGSDEVDQRGRRRTVGPVDIGAFELGAKFGVNACPSVVNSSGSSAVLSAAGSVFIDDNDLTVACTGMPAATTGYFVVSPNAGFAAQPGGSQGNLCLGAPFGRLVDAILTSNAAGSFNRNIDLTALLIGGSSAAVIPGTTLRFQCWFRDSNPTPTSNFSDRLDLLFL